MACNSHAKQRLIFVLLRAASLLVRNYDERDRCTMADRSTIHPWPTAALFTTNVIADAIFMVLSPPCYWPGTRTRARSSASSVACCVITIQAITIQAIT